VIKHPNGELENAWRNQRDLRLPESMDFLEEERPEGRTSQSCRE
jgi:hypothetical protein